MNCGAAWAVKPLPTVATNMFPYGNLPRLSDGTLPTEEVRARDLIPVQRMVFRASTGVPSVESEPRGDGTRTHDVNVDGNSQKGRY